ncbi:MAG: ParB/RepB/Spo0J family partition protein [Actinobacteria bacterium]|nr:ParB/RepB/Spo0J family partition protein [Actinomycetota bacterium]
MNVDAAPSDIRTIPIALIDPPDLAMREKMSDAGLEALADSLRRHGLLQNIGVIVAGDRFRVVYGHRRRLAAELAGLEQLAARVFPEGTADEQALKIDENEEQEPVNAAAQATYYRELLDERCDGDVRKLVRLVRRAESFLLDRLDLTRGDEQVLDALRRNRINLSVAKELNKVNEELYRRLYLHDAMHQGLNARAIRVLRQTRDRDRRLAEAAQPGAAPLVEPSTEVALESLDACLICGSESDQHEMSYRKVHRSCATLMMRDRNDAARERSSK